jgi:hypothetical protein
MPAASRPLSVLALLGLALGAGPARAGLECPEPVAQAGEVRSGTPLAHRFRLVNRGPHAVEITEVHPSCGCLAPRLERRRLAPGEEGALLVEINTLTQAAGTHSWQVRLGYDEEGKAGELALVLGARVVSEVAVTPPAVLLFTDSALAHEITVSDRRPRPLAVTAVEVSSPSLRARLGEARRDGAGRRVQAVQVEVPADCPAGRHEEVLRIFTDDATYPVLEVPVTVVKRPSQQVRAAPEAVELAGPAGQALPSRIVLLSAGDDRPVLVERVVADDPAIECHWAPGPGPRATLKIRVDRSRVAGGAVRGTVRVDLAGPAPQMLLIPVTCTLR